MLRYAYKLSDGQKWNFRKLKWFLPSEVEYTEFWPWNTEDQEDAEVDVEQEVVSSSSDYEEPAAPSPVEPRYPVHERHTLKQFRLDGMCGPLRREGGGEEMMYLRCVIII